MLIHSGKGIRGNDWEVLLPLWWKNSWMNEDILVVQEDQGEDGEKCFGP